MNQVDFNEQYIGVMRGWDRLHALRHPGQDRIIDIDIAPEATARQYEDTSEVRTDLEAVAADIPAAERDQETLTAMLGANLMYLRATEGEKIDFETYTEGTIGIQARPIDEDRIKAGAAVLDMLLKEEGLRYEASSRDAFRERFTLTSQREIRRAFLLGMKTVEAALDQYIDVTEGGFRINYVNKDVYWVGSLSGNSSGLDLAVNTHPRHPLSRGRISTIAAHEYGGHGAQLRLWSRSLRMGIISPAVGITAVHTPYAVQAEALAQNAEHILLDDSWGSILQAHYNQQVGRVHHNMHYRINTGHSPGRVLEYGRRRLPLEPDENISLETIKAYRDNPLYRAYLGAYAPSLELVEPIRALSEEARRAVLTTLYNRPLTPSRMARVVEEAARRDKQALTEV